MAMADQMLVCLKKQIFIWLTCDNIHLEETLEEFINNLNLIWIFAL